MLLSTRNYLSAHSIADTRYSLAAVNFFLGIVGITQVGRIMAYQRTLKNQPTSKTLEDDIKNVATTSEGIVKDPQGAKENAAAT